jgi:hypothetical protein
MTIQALTTDELIVWHTERRMMEIWCRETINPCLLKWGKPTQFEVFNPKKEEYCTIRAKSVNDIRLLSKFFASEDGEDLDKGAVDNIGDKVSRYAKYLINIHKKNYQYIVHDDEIRDFNTIVSFVMIMRSAEWRNAEGRFKDPGAKQRVARLLERRAENEALSKAHGHEKKHGEDSTFQKTMDEFQERVNATFLPPYEHDLPPLPQGSIQPLAWLTTKLEEE